MPPPLRTIYLMGPANSGKTWMKTVVFEHRLPLDLVLERRETQVSVCKVRNTDFLHLDIWGMFHPYIYLQNVVLTEEKNKLRLAWRCNQYNRMGKRTCNRVCT